MRAVIQRVKQASVTVGTEVTGSIGTGLLVLLGVEPADTADDIAWLAQRIASLRLFPSENGPWDRSISDEGFEVLVVSQFTLFASTRKGTKPSWHRAAKPDVAEALCDQFVSAISAILGRSVKTGRFGAMMDVSLVNDGPVTLILDSKARE